MLKGVIINTLDPNHINIFTGKWTYEGVIPGEAEVEEEGHEEYQDEINNRFDKLDSLTLDYMSGQDDGKDFIASDNERAIECIREIFPEFVLCHLNEDNYSWDYNYKRDL